ncbi:hypothetical protein EYF80_017558 [Liparis tanakae]|uniref:Uncharacterized protein n=1 Tax=Liparis tanakae TaxID=230148 RepID=A0A4Z2I4P6_9TELE|nr:hypothetical protein EYF80_017558 [Liparis tanakae]
MQIECDVYPIICSRNPPGNINTPRATSSGRQTALVQLRGREEWRNGGVEQWRRGGEEERRRDGEMAQGLGNPGTNQQYRCHACPQLLPSELLLD